MDVDIEIPDEDRHFYRVWRTVQQMLNKRGYNVQDTLGMSLETFSQRYREEPTHYKEPVAALIDDEQSKICVFFTDDDKMGAKQIQALVTNDI